LSRAHPLDVVQCVAAATHMLRLAAFADDVAGFDASAFRLARAEAVALDPQSRTLLHRFTAARHVYDAPLLQSAVVAAAADPGGMQGQHTT
jgi:acyl transferase domain-containing protein